MMGEKLDALRGLLAKVEAGDVAHGKLAFRCLAADGKIADQQVTSAYAAYHGDLNAAKALHKALLPRHYAQVHMWPMPEMCLVNIGGGHTGRDDDPARAWLITILKALIAKAEAAE